MIHGDLDKDVITLYQHGTSKDDLDNVLVSPGEEVILLLMETTEDFYWPYSPAAGVRKVETDGCHPGLIACTARSSRICSIIFRT